jgi:hypothetical protein
MRNLNLASTIQYLNKTFMEGNMASVSDSTSSTQNWIITDSQGYRSSLKHKDLIKNPNYLYSYVRGRFQNGEPTFTRGQYIFEKQLNTWKPKNLKNLTLSDRGLSYSCYKCEQTKKLWKNTFHQLNSSDRTVGFSTEILCDNHLKKLFPIDPLFKDMKVLRKSPPISFSYDEAGIAPIEETWNTSLSSEDK